MELSSSTLSRAFSPTVPFSDTSDYCQKVGFYNRYLDVLSAVESKP